MSEKPDQPWPVLDPLDRRLNAHDGQWAEERLRGRVEAREFLAGTDRVIAVPVADLRTRPEPASGLQSQLVLGDRVRQLREIDGWSWVRSIRDGYVGWTPSAGLGAAAGEPTHRLIAPRSFIYDEPDMKTPPRTCLSMGSALVVTGETVTRGTPFALLADGGAIIRHHLQPVGEPAGDYVAVAERLLATPYLWGGTSAFGVDCSGLVQLAMLMAGRIVLRDSDMQAATIGEPVDPGADWSGLQRGDLVFWKGHVAICTQASGGGGAPPMLLHANGSTMDVSLESAASAVERIALLFAKPIGVRRPPPAR